jgi:hypothetical protein
MRRMSVFFYPDKHCTERASEYHLRSFSHPGVLDFRPKCIHKQCRDRDLADHVTRFSHPDPIQVRPHQAAVICDSTVTPCSTSVPCWA